MLLVNATPTRAQGKAAAPSPSLLAIPDCSGLPIFSTTFLTSAMVRGEVISLLFHCLISHCRNLFEIQGYALTYCFIERKQKYFYRENFQVIHLPSDSFKGSVLMFLIVLHYILNQYFSKQDILNINFEN